jgi:hypothetical protein
MIELMSGGPFLEKPRTWRTINGVEGSPPNRNPRHRAARRNAISNAAPVRMETTAANWSAAA